MVCDRRYHRYHRYRCAVGPHHATSASAAGWHHPTHHTSIPSPTVPHPRSAHRVARPYPIALPVSMPICLIRTNPCVIASRTFSPGGSDTHPV